MKTVLKGDEHGFKRRWAPRRIAAVPGEVLSLDGRATGKKGLHHRGTHGGCQQPHRPCKRVVRQTTILYNIYKYLLYIPYIINICIHIYMIIYV